MPDKHDLVRIRHMVDAAGEAIGYVEDGNQEDFLSDRRNQHSVIRCLEIIGEAAARITPETRAMLPQVPWKQIIGMRNRLIHAYFDIDIGVVWKAAQDELPSVKAALEQYLAHEEPKSPDA